MTAAIPVQRSYQLTYHANWELVTLWVRNILVAAEEGIYAISYIWKAELEHFKQMKHHRSYALNLSSWENKPWKKKHSGLNENRTHDRCDTGAVVLPTELSSQLGAGHVENSQRDQLPDGLIAELLMRAQLHRYRSGHKFESRASSNLFQALFSQLLKLSA